MKDGLVKRVYLFPVRFYKKHISPALGGNCIYTPTCSSYFEQSVLKHGIIKGSILGISRILRCNRLFMGGPDPVPQYFTSRSLKDPYIVFRRRRIRKNKK
ncbi:MAG: membrane protein insertion efficiency factor YidD [Sphaerochaetaceae bacterium]|nr:membrane protein insertion efficiency factor YidD [Sphaerochaetaceae bacterium]